MLINIAGYDTILELLHKFRLEVEQETVYSFLLLKQSSVGNE